MATTMWARALKCFKMSRWVICARSLRTVMLRLRSCGLSVEVWRRKQPRSSSSNRLTSLIIRRSKTKFLIFINRSLKVKHRSPTSNNNSKTTPKPTSLSPKSSSRTKAASAHSNERSSLMPLTSTRLLQRARRPPSKHSWHSSACNHWRKTTRRCAINGMRPSQLRPDSSSRSSSLTES